MNEKEKFAAMTDAAKQLKSMILSRLNNRIETLNALAGSPVDSLPDDVRKMREIEACKIRAVVEEQKDLIAIIKMLFPNA